MGRNRNGIASLPPLFDLNLVPASRRAIGRAGSAGSQFLPQFFNSGLYGGFLAASSHLAPERERLLGAVESLLRLGKED